MHLLSRQIKSGDYDFTTGDFRDINPDKFTAQSFFYADPPYLIACATYNEQNGWTEDDEKDLLEYLDRLHTRGIRFALSNVLENKGRKNDILIHWLKAHKEYRSILLNYDYSNSSYHGQKTGITKEVLIVNYETEG